MDFSISIALGSMPKMGMNIHNINPERNAFLVYGIVPTMETIPKSMAVFEMHVCLSVCYN